MSCNKSEGVTADHSLVLHDQGAPTRCPSRCHLVDYQNLLPSKYQDRHIEGWFGGSTSHEEEAELSDTVLVGNSARMEEFEEVATVRAGRSADCTRRELGLRVTLRAFFPR